MNNLEIDMSSPIVKGMEYKSFFGLHGALPMAFTERVLFFSVYDQIASFFDEIFANFIVAKEQEYYEIVHNYIKLFKRRKKPNLNKIKLVKINENFNKVGKTKISRFLLGKKSPVVVEEDQNLDIIIGKTPMGKTVKKFFLH